MSASATQDGFVVFDKVQKSYDGETLVVKDLNLSVGKGEFLTMLGPSGSGKTTCLMMLAGFETATNGEILLDGKPINSVPPHKRGIGMVFQNYALFPHMTVGENLAFPLEVRGMGKSDRERQDQARARHGADGRFHEPAPGAAVGRAATADRLARALVFEPELVLMDEPLGRARQAVARAHAVRNHALAHELGITTVYVTHDQTEALDHVGQRRRVRRRAHPAACAARCAV